MKIKITAGLLIAVVLLLFSAAVVFAGSGDQPIEWEGNPGNWRWSLTYRGQGWQIRGDLCDWNDYVFWINKNGSTEPDRLRIYSSNSTVTSAFSGKSPIGHDHFATRPYICLGYRDTRNAGGTSNVASNLFVWVKP